MQYTYPKREKKQFVRLLEAAKLQLWDGVEPKLDKEKYICYAICTPLQRETSSVIKLREYITYMLGCATVEEWLRKQKILALDDIGLSYSKIQQYRLDWINHMIKEFSK
jgi:hypothetical protein